MCEYKGCRVPSEPGEKLCILHKALPKDIDRFAAAINQQIRKDEGKTSPNARFAFAGYCFPGNIGTTKRARYSDGPNVYLPEELDSDLCFRNAIVAGWLNFRETTVRGSIDFSRATIRGGACFRRAKIKGDADFAEAEIEGADFGGATVQGNIDFSNAVIDSDLLFEHARIGGYANFYAVEVKENGAAFEGVVIGQEAVFSGAKIDGDFNFNGATIRGAAGFGGAKITGNANFARVMIEGSADFHGTAIEGSAVFSGAKICGKASFRKARIEGDAIFGEVLERGVDTIFEARHIARNMWNWDCGGAEMQEDADLFAVRIAGDANFDGVKIQRALHLDSASVGGKLSLARCLVGSLDLGQGKPQMRGWRLDEDRCGITLHDASTASHFWRFAQVGFARNGDREAADAAYYFERVWHWKGLRRIEAAKGCLQAFRTMLLRTLFTLLWLLDCVLLRWATAYGASISRLFTTWVVVIGGFGVTFSLRPCMIQGPSAEGILWDWIRGFHYSISTFATLGLGNIDPGSSRLGMALTSIEAILGAILIALAVLVIGRKFMR